jgi:adenine-specific DNA-methyltransferase
LSVYVQQQHSICDFSGKESWVVLSPIEQSIKRKIEAVGTPLKDWDIKIYRGVLTGCNDAFIIPTKKRNEILANCKTEDECQRTAELIRPILRGRDIKRYGYNWDNKWLIATFPSRHYNIDDYPTIKDYFLSFGIERLEQTGKMHIINGEKVKSRKKTNNKWYETQDSISYMDDFNKPKIIYPETTIGAYFAYDTSGFYLDKTCFMIICPYAKYLQNTLSSNLFEFAYRKIFSSIELGGYGYQYNKHALVELPIIDPNNITCQNIKDMTNESIYTLYSISEDEQIYIEKILKKMILSKDLCK